MDDFYDVTIPDQVISDEELEILLNFNFTRDDWDRSGPCKSFYQLRNEFVDIEDAKLTINRILTALNRIRNVGVNG